MPSKSQSKSSSGGAAKSAMARIAHLMDPEADLEAVDAIDVLKAQHREVERLFGAFKKAEDQDEEAAELARTICTKLTVHATIEEEIFYPAARQANKADDIVLEALEEHLSAKRIIADIQGLEAGDERLKAKVSVLQEQINHHVEEEEDELFPKVRKALAKGEREDLGKQLVSRARELEAGNGRSRGSSNKSRPSRA